MKKNIFSNLNKAVLLAIAAAGLYALSTPFAKVLLNSLSPTFMAALLYLGAGSGMLLLGYFTRNNSQIKHEMPLTKAESPYVIGMILLDIAAPILLMTGLTRTTAANASLLNNFEIVATSLIAIWFFREIVSRRLWMAIIFVTIASVILSVEDGSSLHFSFGSVLVLLATICWGLENNLTRRLSQNNPMHVVVIKGFGSGLGSLLIALALGEITGGWVMILAALLLGFVAYGLSIYFYVRAQRDLGAAKTSTFYAAAPFFGALLAILVLGEQPTLRFFVALALMIVGVYFSAVENAGEVKQVESL